MPHDSCVEFIDGTNISIAHPKGVIQIAAYSGGHKQINGIEFQLVTPPDGIIFHLLGPLEATLHYISLFRKS